MESNVTYEAPKPIALYVVHHSQYIIARVGENHHKS